MLEFYDRIIRNCVFQVQFEDFEVALGDFVQRLLLGIGSLAIFRRLSLLDAVFGGDGAAFDGHVLVLVVVVLL